MSRPPVNPKRKAADEPRPIRLWELLFRPRLVLLILLIAGGLAFAPFVPIWRQRLRSQEEFRITPADIVVNPPHDWAPEQLVQEILAECPPVMSLLDESLVNQVAEAFERNPWIESVDEVRKSREGIEVAVTYRMPVMFVKNSLGYYPVDGVGVMLPPTDFSAEDTERLPVFVSGGSSPTGKAGEAWDDAVVLSAVALAQYLVPDGDTSLHWDRFRLATLHVEEVVGSETGELAAPVFLLRTDGGSEIVWGRSPREEFAPLEPTPEEKLARMVYYCEQFGDFESPSGPYRIDIRPFERISQRPLDPSIR